MSEDKKTTDFSLSCHGCDAGDGVGTMVDAVVAGWLGITYDPDGLSWNFIGTCPDCSEEDNKP